MSGKSLVARVNMNMGRLRSTTKKAFQEAKEKGAVQLLTWANAGSPNESATPPIRFGILRGSSTAFVGNKLITVYDQAIQPGSNETISPAKSYSGKDNVITVVWNVAYATRLHEERGKTWHNLGPFSEQAGNATDKWLEKHLARDKEAVYKLMASVVKKEFNK